MLYKKSYDDGQHGKHDAFASFPVSGKNFTPSVGSGIATMITKSKKIHKGDNSSNIMNHSKSHTPETP